jgi:hypothetical protein
MSTGPGRCRYARYRAALLSFEGPSAEALRRPASAKLENCTEPKKGLKHTAVRASVGRYSPSR